MASCKVRGTTSGCRCTLRYLEAHASLGALRQAELQMVRGGRAPRFLIAAVTACRSAGA
jgi:hypothetical protein